MISIIIPVFNEAAQICNLIGHIHHMAALQVPEIIVVDGGSTDDSVRLAEQAGARIIKSAVKNRAAQLNAGAAAATHDLLYFLHADSLPPKGFDRQILGAIQSAFACGCFRLQFNYNHWFLRSQAWFTRFDVNLVRFGDQSLFVTKAVFIKAGGYDESLLMMEDQEIIHRLKKYGRFIVLNDTVVTSARKYRDNGVLRLQLIFYLIWSMYYLGFSQQRMLRVHRKLIRNHKL